MEIWRICDLALENGGGEELGDGVGRLPAAITWSNDYLNSLVFEVRIAVGGVGKYNRRTVCRYMFLFSDLDGSIM